MYRTTRRRLAVVAVIAWIAAVGLACLITTSIVPIQWVASRSCAESQLRSLPVARSVAWATRDWGLRFCFAYAILRT